MQVSAKMVCNVMHSDPAVPVAAISLAEGQPHSCHIQPRCQGCNSRDVQRHYTPALPVAGTKRVYAHVDGSCYQIGSQEHRQHIAAYSGRKPWLTPQK